MSTRPIGPGTCNFPLNMRVDERSLLGQLAFPKVQAGEFRGVGDYVRHLVLVGLQAENPSAALRLREIRNGCMACALLMLICTQMLASWFGHDDDEAMRRARGQRVRVVKTARVGRTEI